MKISRSADFVDMFFLSSNSSSVSGRDEGMHWGGPETISRLEGVKVNLSRESVSATVGRRGVSVLAGVVVAVIVNIVT